MKKIFGLGITLVLLGISTSTVAKATPGDLTFPPLNITYQSRPGTALGQYTENGKLLIWGKFDSINGVPNSGFSRVNTDFTLDNSFNPPSEFSPANGFFPLVISKDGFLMASSSRTELVHLFSDGQLDATFQSPLLGNSSSSVQLAMSLPNGKYLLQLTTV